jgi:hypothetical protein
VQVLLRVFKWCQKFEFAAVVLVRLLRCNMNIRQCLTKRRGGEDKEVAGKQAGN